MCKPDLCATCINADVSEINYPCRQCMSENDRHDYFKYDVGTCELDFDKVSEEPIKVFHSQKQLDRCTKYWSEKLGIDLSMMYTFDMDEFNEYDMLHAILSYMCCQRNVVTTRADIGSVVNMLLATKYDLPYSYFEKF